MKRLEWSTAIIQHYVLVRNARRSVSSRPTEGKTVPWRIYAWFCGFSLLFRMLNPMNMRNTSGTIHGIGGQAGMLDSAVPDSPLVPRQLVAFSRSTLLGFPSNSFPCASRTLASTCSSIRVAATHPQHGASAVASAKTTSTLICGFFLPIAGLRSTSSYRLDCDHCTQKGSEGFRDESRFNLPCCAFKRTD